MTRRQMICGGGSLGCLAVGSASYAFGIEPGWRLETTSYRVALPKWRKGRSLRIAALSDIHAGETYMTPDRIAHIVACTNALKPDLVVLLGDFVIGKGLVSNEFAPSKWASMLARLCAPLGRFAVLGNHDWLDDDDAMRRFCGPVRTRVALEQNGITVLENDAVRLVADGQPIWLLGLADQIAFAEAGVADAAGRRGPANLAKTLAAITDDSPAILLAHEPDIFPEVPDRVALTLSGHTHGGQIRIAGWSPIVPSIYGNRYAYGHVKESIRHLIVSGGLGTSSLPVRLGVPPEIVIIEINAV